MNVSVIGLGKLGAPLAAVLAAKGHNVIGVDLNNCTVQSINNGIAPVDEPQLQDMINRAQGRLSATTCFRIAALDSDVTCIIVPTPSDTKGAFSNTHVLNAIRELGNNIRSKSSYHVVCITSTVMPGSCDGEIRSTLESASGRRVGFDIGLCYSPEFIALGRVIHDLMHPDMVLVGESDPRAGEIVSDLILSACTGTPPVQRMNLVNAELTKITVNTFVTTKISYANMLSDICDRLPGADVKVLTSALGLDSRIGSKYLQGATGYGGPCFPRDNIAFSSMARALGASPLLAEATETINQMQLDRMANKITTCTRKGDTVAVLGLSYKPDTSVVEESHGIKLAQKLAKTGFKVLCHDPKAGSTAQAVLGQDAWIVISAAEAITAAQTIVVMTPWQEYGTLSHEPFQRTGRPVTVIDPWRIVPHAIAKVAHMEIPGRNNTSSMLKHDETVVTV
ncbi:UDP-glucose/GDP-mannose dehydrogenase family protein [Haematospirillum jordaniae]|uniref:UDP-glucose 6-dehydrogenase n=1 Tax=Haematospirillum jordaniae TaxID=1549855 RepID=A0A143DCW8_9PROT|nr:nucleotide sugar dehydrogenase [Haematospirillum jordaniae]AMW34380.1 hypothetical protein AY555_03340 [Haematospirillum jordaniae]NKD44648.1 UDP-glucose/GDP-mannose dehydrogenase family protein [Haematospirillum jordaniae]NKD57668.1 UDP-glucose/GDP-mannose dehydrogenase family protein [Haematospirillum jordaniae]NKD59238.1 UDP-glucose/GDP-mannose dehydrogenase family protein [Haematospirillum jordaniae]NKD67376.1 UDP-glucose/GDP-mannose dehydrogenase family protein [Haematospirillum jordan